MRDNFIFGEKNQQLFSLANQRKFALPAINVSGTNTINSVLETASELNSPVIIQFSNGGSQFIAGKGMPNKDFNTSIAGSIAGAYHIHKTIDYYNSKVIIHTDHCSRKLLPWIDGLLDYGKDFYNKNIGKYTPIQKIQFQSIYINSLNQESVLLGTESDLKTLQPKLLKLYDELNTKDFLDIKYSYDENNFFEVPDKLINIKDCNLLFGKSICNQIASLNIDEVSQPIFFDNGYFIFKLVDQIKQEVDENYYNEIREKIIFDYNNGLDDEKLKNYLKYLKDNSEIIRYSF